MVITGQTSQRGPAPKPGACWVFKAETNTMLQAQLHQAESEPSEAKARLLVAVTGHRGGATPELAGSAEVHPPDHFVAYPT
eukprot:15142972-Alexandrium_andersonii.AAC.2